MVTAIEIWQAAKRGETSGDGWTITEQVRLSLARMRHAEVGEETQFQAVYWGPRFRLVDVGGGLHELRPIDPPDPHRADMR